MATSGGAGWARERDLSSTEGARLRPAANNTVAPATVRASSAGLADTGARRVLTILRYLAAHQRPSLASAIARDCGYPRSSTYRLLHVMEEERFITYYPDEGRWGLGVASYELGTGYLLGDPLARQSAGILAKLSAETGTPAAIGVLDGVDAIISRAHRPDRAPAPVEAEPGVRYPAHLTALGWALLIDRSRAELVALFGDRPLARPAGTGPATVDELVSGLRAAAERGYTEYLGDPPEGITAVAAPVRSAAGRVVAALTAGFLGSPQQGEPRRRTISAVVRAAADLSGRLGYRSARQEHRA